MTNFKNQSVKIVVAFTTLIVIHTVIVYSWQPNDPVASSQWGQNQIRTERYLFNSAKTDCVLVGSSMSASLALSIQAPSDKLPRIVNLAHAAGSPMTGMQLVADARTAPYCLLVEANLGYKRADLEHLELFQNPFVLTMKQHILNTRHENQPLNMMLSFVKTLRNSFTKKTTLATANPVSVENPVVTKTPEEVERALNRVTGLQDITDDYLLSGLEIMFDLAEQIEKRGTRVIFFEMPGEEVVRNSHYYSILRQQFAHTESSDSTAQEHNRFMPSLQILDIGASVRTTDGIHLDASSLQRVPAELFTLIDNLTQ